MRRTISTDQNYKCSLKNFFSVSVTQIQEGKMSFLNRFDGLISDKMQSKFEAGCVLMNYCDVGIFVK